MSSPPQEVDPLVAEVPEHVEPQQFYHQETMAVVRKFGLFLVSSLMVLLVLQHASHQQGQDWLERVTGGKTLPPPPPPTHALPGGVVSHPYHTPLRPDSVGAFLSVYRNPKAVLNVLREYREAYPEGDLVVACDEGCYNFTDLCAHYRAIWDGRPRRLTTKTDPGWYLRLPNIHAYLDTLAYALPFIRSKFYMYLETDVAIKSRLSVEGLHYTLNGIVPTGGGWFVGAEPFFAAHLNPTFVYNDWPMSPKEGWRWIPYGGQGGTILHTQFMRAIALQPPEHRIPDERVLSACSTTIGVDYMHTALVYRYNGTVGPFAGYHLSHNPADAPGLYANPTVQIFHADKTYYNQPLSQEDLELLGPNWENTLHIPPSEKELDIPGWLGCQNFDDFPVEGEGYTHRLGDTGLKQDERDRGNVWDSKDIRGPKGYYWLHGPER